MQYIHHSTVKTQRVSDTMKVAFFLAHLGGGGTERVVLNLAYGLVQQGISVDLVLLSKAAPYESLIPQGVSIVLLKSSRISLSIPALVNYLKQQTPNILISALEDNNIIAILAKQISRVPTKVIATVHNNLLGDSQKTLRQKLLPRLIRYIYPYADVIVGVSQGVIKDLIRLGSPPKKTYKIYNPVVMPCIFAKSHEEIEHPWFSPNQPPVILGVGRLDDNKNFSDLIHAFALVRNHRSARLVILGEGVELPNLRSFVRDLNLMEEVDFPGFVVNPFAYMSKARVLVLSSIQEGFGNVLVEAMALGTPVVSTSCDGPSEILAHGQYGKLVAAKDVSAMAKAIIEVLTESPNQNNLRSRAQEFSLEHQLPQYLKLFDLLLA